MAGGVSPFTYGPDGWLLMHFNVCNNQGTTCNWCLTQKYWGFKPIADNCYALTCNAIVPDITCSSNCLIYYLCQNTGSSCFACEFNSASNCTYQGGIVDAGYMWDQGDCIKRQFVQGFSWDNCGTSSWQSALQMAVQCFCVGAGPCLYILGSTCCNRAQSCFCYVGCCCFPITPPGNFAPNSSVCGQYLACCPCCGAVSPYVGLASCVTFGGPGAGGSGQVSDGTWYSRIGSYLARLYFAGTPYCWQLGCYYFSTTAAMACGGEWSCGYPTGAIGTLFEANPPYINVCVCCNCNASGTFNCSQCGITLSDCYTAVRGQFRACQLNYWQAGCTSPVRNVPSVFMIDCCYSNGLNPFQSYFYDAYGAYCNVVNGIGCYWNCCRATPIGYQNGPIAMNNGRYIVNFTNSGVFNTYTYFQTSGQLPANQHIISVSAVCSTPTAQCFIGIAQNTVSAGGTVCYAVPGMTDGSNFGTVLSAFSGGSTSGYCTCLLCCFCVTCNACVGTQYLPIYPVNACSGINLTGGVGCNCSSCTYGSVRFTSIYDTGLSKYSTIITPHC